MKLATGTAYVLWILLGIPLLVISVVTALTLVFSILGLVAMFVFLAVPFGFAPPALKMVFRPSK